MGGKRLIGFLLRFSFWSRLPRLEVWLNENFWQFWRKIKARSATCLHGSPSTSSSTFLCKSLSEFTGTAANSIQGLVQGRSTARTRSLSIKFKLIICRRSTCWTFYAFIETIKSSLIGANWKCENKDRARSTRNPKSLAFGVGFHSVHHVLIFAFGILPSCR